MNIFFLVLYAVCLCPPLLFVNAVGDLYFPEKINGDNQIFVEDKCLFFGSDLKNINACRYNYKYSTVYCELYKKNKHYRLVIPVEIKEGDLTEIEYRTIAKVDMLTGILQETNRRGFYQMVDTPTNKLAWVGCSILRGGSQLNLDGHYGISRFIITFTDNTSIDAEFTEVNVRYISKIK